MRSEEQRMTGEVEGLMVETRLLYLFPFIWYRD